MLQGRHRGKAQNVRTVVETLVEGAHCAASDSRVEETGLEERGRNIGRRRRNSDSFHARRRRRLHRRLSKKKDR